MLTVGWGSRETQFQGVVGRKNREKLDVNKTPISVLLHDKRQVLIQWRADAQFFTVSTVDEFPTKVENDQLLIDYRQLRVWNRNLELVSKCEFLAGTEDILCMKFILLNFNNY